jgi:protein FAM50
MYAFNLKDSLDDKKRELESELTKKNQIIQGKFFNSNNDIYEEEFKNNTVGLVTREEFKRKRENIENIVAYDQEKKNAFIND